MKITLIQPNNGQTVSQLSREHEAFLTAGGNRDYTQEKLDWLNLQRQGEDTAYPEPVVFRWALEEALRPDQKVYLTLGDNRALSGSHTYECTENAFYQYNLLLGKTYFWRVCVMEDGSAVAASHVYSFTVSPRAPRWIKAGGLSNIRDIGGWRTTHGAMIRQGMVYRGCEMEFHHLITPEGKDVLTHQLGIKTDLDLRMEAVGKIHRSALGEGVALALIPAKAYDSFLEEKQVCKQIFTLFTDEKNYPVYVHCWGGADRTGTVIFLLCGMLGMVEEDLFLDYEMTTFCVWGGRSIKSDLFLSFMKVLDRYGSETDGIQEKCVNYLLAAGVTREDIRRICQILLTQGN